jgi:hypothetical protein
VLDLALSKTFDLGFSVGHQKVELDVDLASKGLRGTTEITVHHVKFDLLVSHAESQIKRACRGTNGEFDNTRHRDKIKVSEEPRRSQFTLAAET